VLPATDAMIHNANMLSWQLKLPTLF